MRNVVKERPTLKNCITVDKFIIADLLYSKMHFTSMEQNEERFPVLSFCCLLFKASPSLFIQIISQISWIKFVPIELLPMFIA